MTQISVRVHAKGDPPIDRPPVLGHVLHSTEPLQFVVLEPGMVSGEPSVMIRVDDQRAAGVGVTVLLETSLDKLIAATSSLVALAESRFGWTRPVGHATLMPPSRAARRAMLEALVRELREWDALDGEAAG